jgi:hypothetical protein
MKDELLWLDKRMKDALTLPLKDQEDSVFYYIQHRENRRSDSRRSLEDYSLPVFQTSLAELDQVAATIETTEDLEEEISTDFGDFNFEFDLEFDEDSDLDEDGEEEQTNLADKTPLIFLHEDEECDWKQRPEMVFTDTAKLGAEFIFNTFMSFSSEQLFPPSFSFKDLVNGFQGRLYFVYHTSPMLYVYNEGLPIRIKAENFHLVEELKDGCLVMALPEPILQMADWCFRPFHQGIGEAKREILLIKYPMERPIFRYISGCQNGKSVLVFNDVNMTSQALERLEVLPNIKDVLFLNDFHFRNFLNLLECNYPPKGQKRRAQQAILTGTSLWRSLVNSWINKQEDQGLDEIFTLATVDVCNEWWLSSSPEDQDLAIALFRCAKAYHLQIEKIKAEIYQLNSQSSYQEKNKAFTKIDGYFNEIVKALLGKK